MTLKPYQLYVQIRERWVSVASFDATDHAHAFQLAMSALKPEHYKLPIRLEQFAAAPKRSRRSHSDDTPIR